MRAWAWALALLHIVAHSLYKAHAFLSSGGAVQAVASLRRPGPGRCAERWAVLKSFALALALYAVIAVLFTAGAFRTEDAAGAGARRDPDLRRRLPGRAGTGRHGAGRTDQAHGAGLACRRDRLLRLPGRGAGDLGPALPAAPVPGPLEWALIVLAVASFGLVAFAQALFPLWAHHPATAGLRVHLANGFYLNALLDRAIGGFRTANPTDIMETDMFLNTPDRTLAADVDILKAAEAAARAIPPAFPLEATVAVNPFLGQTGEDLATASARLQRVAGVRRRSGARLRRPESVMAGSRTRTWRTRSRHPPRRLKPTDLARSRPPLRTPMPAQTLPGLADGRRSCRRGHRHRLAVGHRKDLRDLGRGQFDRGQALWSPTPRRRSLRGVAGLGHA
jgi:hypothetical protein